MSGGQYVCTERRQIEISPGTKAKNCSTEAQPGIIGSRRKRRQASGYQSSGRGKVGAGMNIPVLPALSAPIPDAVKKKRVLLIDTSHAMRDLRADVLRKLGVDVDTAADIAEARIWWRPALYDLVSINMERGRGQRDKFCNDVRSATPPQRVAFLVGQPEYLAHSPNPAQELAMEQGDEQPSIGSAKATFPADPGDTTQRWGILEASRRISAVRSASVVRSQAMRSLPPPPRDSEGRPEKSATTRASLDDLLKEELR
jgi:CheY-like chemotaxis protein